MVCHPARPSKWVPEHTKFFNNVTMPGGSLGGNIEAFNSLLFLTLTGTGELVGFERQIVLQVQCETHTGPRNPG